MASGNSIEPIEYRDISGSPGYLVGNDGSVWTCVAWRPTSTGREKAIGPVWKKMEARVDTSGYPAVVIHKRGRVRVHILVLTSFVGPCPDGLECCHEDGDARNSALANLRWDTHTSNIRDRKKHGTDNSGERNGQSKLTEEVVRAIRFEYAGGMITQPRLAEKYAIHVNTVNLVLRRRRWKHVA